MSRGPLAAGVTLHPEGPVALGCHPAPLVPGGGGQRARSGKVTLADPIKSVAPFHAAESRRRVDAGGALYGRKDV